MMGVQVADFTGAFAVGGQASYVAGAAFDALPLNQPNGTNYVAATASAIGSSSFNIVPLTLSGGVTMSGTVTTNGAAGPANIVDWNIRLHETTEWVFNPTNTRVLSYDGVATDGQHLTVTPFDVNGNPGNFFISGGRIDLSGVFLADFTNNPAGEAGFVTPLTLQTISGLPLDAVGNVVVAQAVPEPASWALLLAGMSWTVYPSRRRNPRVGRSK